MTYRDFITGMEKAWTGRRVVFEGETYNVVGIDYNGGLLIDKPGQFTDTTAVGTWMVEVLP